MTGEKYVKEITKRIHCSAKKKKDIQMQLLGEIRERQDMGEEFFEIIRQMGTVEEVAASFNDSISEKEKKQYRCKRVMCVIAVIFAVVLLLGVGIWWYLPKVTELSKSEHFTEAMVKEQSENIIDLLDRDEYQKLQDAATDQMKEFLTAESMKTAKKTVSEEFGEKQETKSFYGQEVTQKGKHYAVCQIQISYENVSVIYTLTFDQDMKLAGIFLK